MKKLFRDKNGQDFGFKCISERRENGKSKIIPRCPGLDEWWCHHKRATGTGETDLHNEEYNLEHAPFEMSKWNKD